VWLALALLLSLAGCTANDTDKSAGSAGVVVPAATVDHATATHVDMKDIEFQPAHLEVAAGTIVLWTNQDDFGHTVTPDDTDAWGTPGSGSDPSNYLNKDGIWAFRFDRPGTYVYHCIPHATKTGTGYIGMIGTVVVN
jgi:plastocyanin